ncbi:hypothetical protein [Aureivirga sp. CE67]|uniref:hypothetical protein n=1 Tax=Aureivirga sp. CE67 TaxID=1788983 RepID=UPI0018CBBB72|nr:hypothetical protein [Aureivirga sp. CE67]
MKKTYSKLFTQLTLIILFLNSVFGFSQEQQKIFSPDFVECTYSNKTDKPLIIYNKPNGELVKELEVLDFPNCWFKLAITDSRDNWLKIENLMVLPGCEDHELNQNIEKYKEKWIKAEQFEIFLPDIKNITFKFYKESNKKSKVIFETNDFLKVNIIETKGLWAKVKFIYNEKEYKGWLEKKYQCAYPWTTCSVEE